MAQTSDPPRSFTELHQRAEREGVRPVLVSAVSPAEVAQARLDGRAYYDGTGSGWIIPKVSS